MSNSQEEFKETLALTLKTIFEDLKQNSKAMAQICVLPTESLEIKIDPMCNDTCPSIQVTYNFLLNKESMEKILDAQREHFSEVDKDTDMISPLTKELRKQLIANGFEYTDDTTHKELHDYSNTIHHMDRTKVIRDGKEVLSCIWGYFESYGKKSKWSYGWPDKLEVLGDDDPIPMSIDEIIELLKEKADEDPS